MSDLRLAVMQFAPRLRDIAGNMARIAQAAGAAQADLLITPELSLTGYDLKDDVHTVAKPLSAGTRFEEFKDFTAILAGSVERSATDVPHNVAALIENGTVTFVHRKVYLPTYGMFDEGRYFGAGDHIDVFELNGWRLGVLVCEDFWHPMLAYLLAMQGVQGLLVMAAAPGRGVWEGGEEGAFFASSDSWERIARTYAQLYGIYVVLCNRCGAEGGVTFAGESLVVAPNAEVIARAGVDEEIIQVTLESDVVRAARTPYAHVRDEDAAFAIREIERIIRQ
jgi:predicted amidohydrolase